MFRIIALCITVSLWFSAAAAQPAPVGNLTQGCVQNYDAAADYFPDKVEVEYAEGFEVTYFSHYKLVSIIPWPGAEQRQEYVLVQCGTPAPAGYAPAQIIEVPVQRFVSMSTSIIPHLEAQGVLEQLVGVDTALFMNNPTVLEKVAAGDVLEVGGGGAGGDANIELLIELEPDLVMAQEFFAGGTTYNQLVAAGLPTVLNADYADTSPLGQAEWGKYVALFSNTEAAANQVFAGVADRYQALQALTADVAQRPTVIASSPYDNVWYMPGADSTIAQLLADAGANFLWQDMPGTSLPLDFEVVLERGAQADYWVNVNQFWGSIDDALADDARFAEFAAVQNGRMWNNNARMNANGGNDYFESGAANPDVILADLIKIFHPELLPEHQLVYYQLMSASRQ